MLPGEPVPTDRQHYGGYTSYPEFEHPYLLAEEVWGL